MLEEAIALDSTFAMAYRKLGVALLVSGGQLSRRLDAVTKAYQFRDHLPDLERYLAEAYYFGDVTLDRPRTEQAYRSMLELDPDNRTALNNLAGTLRQMRRWEGAESLAIRATEVSDIWQPYFGAMVAQLEQGNLDAARATVRRFGERFPDSPRTPWLTALVTSALGRYDSAESHLDTLAAMTRGSAAWQAASSNLWAAVHQVRGRIADTESYVRRSMEAAEQRGIPSDYVTGSLWLARLDLHFRNSADEAVAKVDGALARYPLTDMPSADRPYVDLADFFASAGFTERARRLLNEYEAEIDPLLQRRDLLSGGAPAAAATLALAEGRIDDAIAGFREKFEQSCTRCGLFELAGAYEAAGQPDTAIAVYERLLSLHGSFQVFGDAYRRAPTYLRLGALYEDRDAVKAVEYYNEFVELWKDADPELQPQVADVRARIARLVGER